MPGSDVITVYQDRWTRTAVGHDASILGAGLEEVRGRDDGAVVSRDSVSATAFSVGTGGPCSGPVANKSVVVVSSGAVISMHGLHDARSLQ